MNELALVGGGVRSGKSAFALALARRLGIRRAFVATAQAFDREMEERIALHRAERDGEFATVEEPLDLPAALAHVDADVVVVDCLTLWLSNLLLRGDSAADVAAAVERLAAELARRRLHAVLVTNEVGMGVVPESALGRLFRDVAGRAHQRLARDADRVYLAALGCVLRLRPGPVSLARPEDP
ncbi:MAG: bifunctional adenosylcobinamide kinase/adenosylcobinamide-phosphate guanylyltransferase [Anaeromyxobacteraceae bacterium]